MGAISSVRQRLQDQGIGINIFYDQATEGEERPYIVLMQDSLEPHNRHNGPSKLDRVQVRVLVFADRYETAGAIEGAYTIGGNVRAALDYFTRNNEIEVYFQNEALESVTDKGNKRAFMIEQYYDVWDYRQPDGVIVGTVLESDLEADLQG